MNGDAELIARLRERGDPLETPRPVQHWAYFSSRVGAEMYTEWLDQEGLTEIFIAHEPDRDDLEWRVTCEHTVVPTLDVITAYTDRAAVQAERLGGHYDGWETAILDA